MTGTAVDTVVVGGGVYGCAIAWELAREGREVWLVEAASVAAGASGGAGRRGVRANGRDLRELPLMRIAYELWPDLARRLGAATGYERIGQLRLYERGHDAPDAAVRARTQSSFGIPTEHLDRAAVLALEPGLGTSVRGALHCPLDGVADHTATTHAYAEAARGLGARLIEGVRVDSLARSPSGTEVRLADGGVLVAEGDVILAANAGVPELLRGLDRTLPVWSVLPQVVMSTPRASLPFSRLIGHYHRPLALKTQDGNRVMLSGGWRGRWNEILGQGETTDESVAGNLAQARAVFPELEDFEVEFSRADRWETVCVDGVPILDTVPTAPRVYFLTGWTGHGWALAPAVATLVAEWCLTGRRPTLLDPFRADRFPA